ncbi:MAG: tetratricopeptide repeat protein, partial [Mariniblastus sp.]
MRREISLTLVVIAIECIVFGYLYYQKAFQPTPPQPNLAVVDSFTEEDLTFFRDTTKEPEDWHWLGQAYMAAGYYAEAKATFARAAELMPESPWVAFDNGFCLSRVGQVVEGNAEFQRAIKLGHPKAADAMYFIGRNHLRNEDPENAEIAFRKAVKIPLAKFELAKILYRLGELDEAETLLTEVVRAEKGTVQTFVLRSQIELKRGNVAGAEKQSIEADSKWVRIKSPFGEQRSRLMENNSKFGFYLKAKEAMAKVAQHENRVARTKVKEVLDQEFDLMVHDSFIKLDIFVGRVKEALELIEERIERFGPSSSILLTLGDVRKMRGDDELALEAWKQGIDINSDKSARDCCKRVADFYGGQLADKQKSLLYQAVGAELYAKEGILLEEFELANKQASLAVKYNPESAEAFYLLGRSELGLGMTDAAAISFTRCLELEPTH